MCFWRYTVRRDSHKKHPGLQGNIMSKDKGRKEIKKPKQAKVVV
jgi:hypothetical protein